MSDNQKVSCPECGKEFDEYMQMQEHRRESKTCGEELDEKSEPLAEAEEPVDNPTGDPDETTSESSDDVRDEEDTLQDDSDQIPQSIPDLESATTDTEIGDKWYMIGIGGAGSGIADAVLLRKDAVEQQERLDIWNGAIEGHTILDTNREELSDTYYITNEPGDITNHMIGKSGDGAGESPFIGRKQIWQDISDNNLFDSYDIDRNELTRSQAILLVHSLSKGTGSGATGLLAQLFNQIRYANEDEDEIYGTPNINLDKPLVTASIIPDNNEDDWNPSNMENCLFGLGTLGRHADLVIPFDNGHLKESPEAIKVNLNYEQVSDQFGGSVDLSSKLKTANKTLIHYLEVMSMTSNAEFDAPRLPLGLDVPDMINPPREEYDTQNLDYIPAVFGGPILYSEQTGFPNDPYQYINRGLSRLGRLIDFDPGSAWGGAFIFYGSEDIIDQYEVEMKPTIEKSITEVLRNEYGAKQESSSIPDKFSDLKGRSSMDVSVDHTFIPNADIDQLYMWGLMWNPKMHRIERMAEFILEHRLPNRNTIKTQLLTERGDSVPDNFEQVYGKDLKSLIENDSDNNLRPYTDLIEAQFSFLGAEKRG